VFLPGRGIERSHLNGAGSRGCAGGRNHGFRSERVPCHWQIAGYHTMQFQTGAPFAMKDTSWDHALEVTAGGSGLVAHVDGVLLRKLADQCGLTAALDGAPTLKGRFPQLDQAVLLAEVARVRQVCYPQRQLHSRPADPDCTSYSPASGCPACTSATSTGTTELSGLSHPAPATRTITDPDRTAHLDVRRRDVPAPAAPCQL
jgi:hypothetical protein